MNRSESMEEWEAFCEFLINQQPPLPPSECTADEAIEFLLTLPSHRINKVAERLTAVNLQENPFGSPMVRTYLKLMTGEADGEEYKSDNTGQDDKVDLFEKCLTSSDVDSLNRLVITPNKEANTYFISATILGDPEKYLRLEDELGKPWLFGFSYVNVACQSFVLTKCWRSYVKEKQLDAGDFVFFQRHLTDRRRLFIGCRRRAGGSASRDDAHEFSLSAALDSTSPDTSTKTLELRAKLKEVETPFQPELHEHNIARSDPVLVIYCGDNQDSEEVYFISYIFNELRLRGFTPLRYDLTSSLMTGNPEMLHSSLVRIIIFSMNYAHSRECMDEFVETMGHMNRKNVVIIPVFFKVSFSEVRGQSGPFEEAFTRLGNSVQAAQVMKWREALLELSSINKYQYTKGDEVVLAKNIVGDACLMVKYEMDRERQGPRSEMISILSGLKFSKSSAPLIVGLWGMAGIGKTTITRHIVRTQAEKFDVCYFQPDFHLMCQTKGLSHLREEFFSKIFGEESVFKDVCDTKLSFTRDRFLDKRVLIVLDGVSSARDAEAFVGGFGWFSGAHTIIFTSRNRQVLVECNAKKIYNIQELSEQESLRLCCQFAAEQDWKGKMSELVNYASGIPLALSVLASSVKDQCINDEKEHLRKLRQYPPVKIQDAFRLSFNGRDDNEKSIFLDLACFFRGEYKEHVVNILDGCGLFTDLGIYGLIDESLISLVDNRIEIPNIFQDTGRFFVHQENKEAGKRSRLWDPNDIANVLINNSGTEAIEGIFLDLSGLTFALNPTVFERMYRLRLLKLYCPTSDNHCKVFLPEGLHSLPDELRLLHWERYPVDSLPRNFNPKNLVELNMPYSNLTKLWKGTKNLEKLKRINLSHSRQLTKFPRLSKAKNLEHIDLEGCTSLVKVNSSILHNHKLTFLSLKDCLHLRIMPATVHLEALEVLNLSGCSELVNLHDFSPNLSELYLAGTAITEIPSSIGGLTRLVTLDLENCNRLQYLPPEIRNLKVSAKLPTSSWDSNVFSSFWDVAPPYKRYRLKSVIQVVMLVLRLGKRVQKASTAGTAIREMSSSIGGVTRGVTRFSALDQTNCNRLQHLSSFEHVTPPYKRHRLKSVIQAVMVIVRLRKLVQGGSIVTNLSEVQLGSASTSVSDRSHKSFWEFFSLPERFGQPECIFYMKTGDCKFGNDCKFHHPRNRETHVSDITDSALGSLSHPSRPGNLVCASYFHTGNCSFGPTCIFDHPSLIPTHRNTYSVASKSPPLYQQGFTSSIGDSSSELVGEATKRRRIHDNTSSMDFETRQLSPLGFTSLIGDSSSELVEAPTLEPPIHKNASSPSALSSELVEAASTLCDITQAAAGIDEHDSRDFNEFWRLVHNVKSIRNELQWHPLRKDDSK